MNPPIITPTLLIDQAKCLANIEKMAAKVKRNEVVFRPHFKTHQSHEIGRWFRNFGVQAITVSSFQMAEYFAADGWTDITVAFPVNILEIDRINQLAKNIQLNLVVESVEVIHFIEENLQSPVAIFLKIDAGYHRTGIEINDTIYISTILDKLEKAKNLEFSGFLVHSGHSYKCSSETEILAIHKQSKRKLLELKAAFLHRYPNLKLSIGDTPICSVAEDFSFADEIRPGNFAFYDVMQSLIGSCHLEDISVALACPVVAIHPKRNEIVIYGGGVHFSKDWVNLPNTNQPFYGYLAKLSDSPKDSWTILSTQNYVKSLSQEHGIVSVTDEIMSQTKIGDLLIVLPIHSCMTADLLREYRTLDGKLITAAKY